MIDQALKQTKMLALFNSYLDESSSWREARDSFLKDFEDVLDESHGLQCKMLVLDCNSTNSKLKTLLQKVCDAL